MKCHIEILGIHSKLTSPSLMLSIETQKYIFNSGQSLPRYLAHSKFRNKLANVFVTGINLDSVSSLSELMTYLVLTSKQTYQRRVHGPVGIKSYLELYKNNKFDIIEYGDKEASRLSALQQNEDSYNDENVKVKVLSFNSGKCNPLYTYQGKELKFARDSCASYIVQCKKPTRKFLVEKATALGIPRGKLYSQLVEEKSITLDGKVINPDDVLGPPTKSSVFALINIPSTKYLLSDVSKAISSYFTKENDFDYIFHMSPASVLLHSDYYEFLASLPPHVINVVLNDALTHSFKNTLISPIFPYSDELLLKLNTVFPNNFCCSTKMYPEINSSYAENLKFQFKNLLNPTLGMKIHLNPPDLKGNIEMNDSISPLNIIKMRNEVDKIKLPRENNAINMPYHRLVNTQMKGSDPSILILGTSSAHSDQFRNVSGIWVGDFGSSLLFDCGEGTYGQLCRHFGEDIENALAKLNTIFISHLHGDHYNGVAKLIHERSKITREPINIIAPSKYRYDLEAFKEIFPPFYYNFCSYIKPPHIPGIEFIKFVPTLHTAKSNGIVIKHKSGWKIVYSGDTRPCEELINEGKDATLLIHEATFIDRDLEKAKRYMHSTVREAIEVGGKMNAWRILITHFSRADPRRFEMYRNYNAIIGFDLMKFKLSESVEVQKNMNKILKIYEETRRHAFINDSKLSEEEEE